MIGGNPETPVFLNYGKFVQTLVEFLLIAAAIYLMIKIINSVYKKEPPNFEKSPIPTQEELLLKEIRDILKTKKE